MGAVIELSLGLLPDWVCRRSCERAVAFGAVCRAVTVAVVVARAVAGASVAMDLLPGVVVGGSFDFATAVVAGGSNGSGSCRCC